MAGLQAPREAESWTSFLVEIRMSHPEADRLAIAIAAGYETVSRAEYYIRTGSHNQSCNASLTGSEP